MGNDGTNARIWLGDKEINGRGSFSFGDIPEQYREKRLGGKESCTFTAKFLPDDIRDTIKPLTEIRATIHPGDIDMSALKLGDMAVLDLGDGIVLGMDVESWNDDGSVNVIIEGLPNGWRK